MTQESIQLLGKIIRIKFAGSFGEIDTQKLHEKIVKLTDSSKDPDILMDFAKLDMSGEGTITEAERLLQELPFRRMAIFSPRPSIVNVVSSIIKTLPRQDEIKLFRDELLAREWLQKGRSRSMRLSLR